MSVTFDGAPVSDIDFLSLPIAAGGGVASGGDGKFRVETPWALARFGRSSLKPGWWRLDCEDGPDGVEVRLSSSQSPLIIVPEGSARIYVSDAGGHDVSLLISPWPGAYAFSKLRLHRLQRYETAKLIAGAAGRLVRRKDPLNLLARAARRLMAGQAVGLSLPTTRPVAESPPALARGTFSETRSAITWVSRDKLALRMHASDRLHHSAVSIAQAAFDRDPALMATYSDVREVGRILPHPEWDTALWHSGAFDDAPLFLRAGVSASTLAEVVEQFGPAAVTRIPLPLVDRDVPSTRSPRATTTPKFPPAPRVSIIIPTKYRIDLLAKCLDGLVQKTGYPDLEIIVVDNGVTDPKFPALIAETAKSLSIRTIDDKGPFNFSRLVNAGVKVAGGEVILLLNDDIEPIEAGWLHKLVTSALVPQAGAFFILTRPYSTLASCWAWAALARIYGGGSMRRPLPQIPMSCPLAPGWPSPARAWPSSETSLRLSADSTKRHFLSPTTTSIFACAFMPRVCAISIVVMRRSSTMRASRADPTTSALRSTSASQPKRRAFLIDGDI